MRRVRLARPRQPRPDRVTTFLALVITSLLVAVFAGCAGDQEPQHEFSGVVPEQPRAVADFSLTDQRGENFTFSEAASDVAAVFFGYALCPDVCPTTLADLVRVKRLLGDDAERVSFVWVTVDPERDSPDAMRLRLEVFDPGFIGLTGSREQLEPVWDDFDVVANREDTRDTAAGYLIAHSTWIYLVDGQMKMRVSIPFGTNPEHMAADIAALLEEVEVQ